MDYVEELYTVINAVASCYLSAHHISDLCNEMNPMNYTSVFFKVSTKQTLGSSI